MRWAAALSDDRPAFSRLWVGFLTARAMVALALLVLQGLGWALSQQREPLLLALTLGYLAATLAQRLWARQAPPPPQPGLHWLPTIGMDIALIACLQGLPSAGTMNFTPLFAFPVLMAGILGTLTLALGTTAAITLLQLAWAWWLGSQGSGDATQRLLEAGLTGTAYFVAASLSHLLAARLAREQQSAERSQTDARTQKAVSALVIRNVADGVLVLDAQGAVRLANPAALQLLGRAPQASFPFPLGYLAHWRPLLELAQSAFAGAPLHATDITLLPPGHGPMGLRVRAWITQEPAHTGSRPPEPLCVMFLHDLRELEARLRTEKLAAMGRMSAAVAHEIRNPLAAIVQANELLDEELTDPVHKRLIGMIRQNAERLVRTTEDVLDIARVQHQIQLGHSSAIALDASVQQIWQDWQAHAPQRRHALLLLNAADTQVAFDTEHLRRVLVNLLDNALRYIGSAPDALCLSTQLLADGQAQLQVWSEGAPLDPSVERHLFEPFFSSESRSSGLGLYICRELCQRHGATIRYQRTHRPQADGAAAGNAFSITFRAGTGAAETPSLFDTIVV